MLKPFTIICDKTFIWPFKGFKDDHGRLDDTCFIILEYVCHRSLLRGKHKSMRGIWYCDIQFEDQVLLYFVVWPTESGMKKF